MAMRICKKVLFLIMVLSLSPLDAVAEIFTTYEANIVIDTSDPVQISEAVVTSKVTSLDGVSVVVSSIDDILPAKGWVDFSPEAPKAEEQKSEAKEPEEKASAKKGEPMRSGTPAKSAQAVSTSREIGRYDITVYDSNGTDITSQFARSSSISGTTITIFRSREKTMAYFALPSP